MDSKLTPIEAAQWAERLGWTDVVHGVGYATGLPPGRDVGRETVPDDVTELLLLTCEALVQRIDALEKSIISNNMVLCEPLIPLIG